MTTHHATQASNSMRRIAATVFIIALLGTTLTSCSTGPNDTTNTPDTRISTFYATPSTITEGTSLTLTWSATGAQECTLQRRFENAGPDPLAEVACASSLIDTPDGPPDANYVRYQLNALQPPPHDDDPYISRIVTVSLTGLQPSTSRSSPPTGARSNQEKPNNSRPSWPARPDEHVTWTTTCGSAPTTGNPITYTDPHHHRHLHPHRHQPNQPHRHSRRHHHHPSTRPPHPEPEPDPDPEPEPRPPTPTTRAHPDLPDHPRPAALTATSQTNPTATADATITIQVPDPPGATRPRPSDPRTRARRTRTRHHRPHKRHPHHRHHPNLPSHHHRHH